MLGLVVVEGKSRGAHHVLSGDVARLGRDPTCEVPLDDERASRVHAEVRIGPGGALLVDLGSTNGTAKNGVRALEPTPLEPGDLVRIGEVVLLVVDEEHEAAAVGAGLSTLCLPLDEPTPSRPVPARRVEVGVAPESLLGGSPALREVSRRILKAAVTDAPVLVTGETGTGKELTARAIHRNSPRRRGPFVAVNGAVLRGELLESELFGHEKGAFTGAVARRKGAFELARGGTLFLDEVGDLPPGAQAALLRVLEGHGFRRLGGSEVVVPDARLVTATHVDLEAAVASGRLRRDLLHRLAVLTLELPPLRARPGDVAALAEHFLREARARSGAPAQRFAPDALAALERYPWPGNVRELRNVVERAAIFGESEAVELHDLPPAVRAAAGDAPEPARLEPAPAAPAKSRGDDFPTLREVEREHVRAALTRSGWNKAAAARLLGIDRVTLYAKIERLGIEA